MCFHHRLSASRDFAQPDAQPHYAPDLGIEPTHLEIGLTLDLDQATATGTVTTTFTARRGDRRRVTLNAVDFHDVQVEAADGHALTSSYDGEHVELCWAEAPAKDETRRVTITYRIEQPLTGMSFSRPDADYPDRARFMVTDHETERARFWLPCVDHPTVRTPLDIRLRAPSDLTILANGLEQASEDHGNGTRTAHWKLEQACPAYLICLAVGDFVEADGGEAGGVPIKFFAPAPHTAEALALSFGKTAAIMVWMTGKLAAPFPFPKYFQFAGPQVGGAMENISLTTWDDAFVLDPTLATERAWIVDIINVHEMAHSYFGDSLVIRDFAHAWLKESWATYMESLWLEDTQGAAEFHAQLHEEARSYMSEADGKYTRPIVTRRFDSSWDMFDHHLYPGGAWRIHMLRHVVGDTAFWAGVQDYVRTFAGKTVETGDFKRKLEEHSGLSLGRFFDQWLCSPGYPKLKVTFKHCADKGEATLTVEQKQVDAKKGIAAFAFPLEFAFEGPMGEWTRHVIEVDKVKHTRVIPCAARPQQVVIDPEHTLLHKLDFDPGSDMTRRTLTDCPHLPGQLWAVQALAKSGKAGDLAALRKAWKPETHWSLRLCMARSLGAVGTQGAADVLAGALETEDHPRVLQHLASNCGQYRDAEMTRALLAFLERELPYMARGSALAALGAQRGSEHVETLAAGLDDPSWWGWVRRGAADGLGKSRTAAATELLIAASARGAQPVQVRVRALAGLAQAGRFQEPALRERALETLVDATRDPDYTVRMWAARAIGTLGESGGSGALRAVIRTLAPQDAPDVRRIAKRLGNKRPHA
ncbi:M1 family aminopeptidase, partial [Planctomycetota bacterium]|nr:M1 family aminopeptidase [Planctomycetota bacterium]